MPLMHAGNLFQTILMRQPIEQLCQNDLDWQQLCQQLRTAIPLTALVLTA